MKYPINIPNVRNIQKSIWEKIKQTFKFRKGFGEPLPVYGHYGGIFKCGEEQLVMHTDGVGTKLLVAQALNKFDTVGIDAVAMSVNDILCVGAEPLVGVDYIGLAKEDKELVAEIMKGLVKGAEESGCAIIGGETAIIPDIIKGYYEDGSKAFDLTFTVIGRIKKLITGDSIKPGEYLIGLESSGIHSNGYTLARKVLDIKKWGEEMLTPTKIYSSAVLDMIDACDIHGIAHITGGAFSKLPRLNKDVGYEITDLPEKRKEIFNELERKVKDPVELYRTFNMGVGMVIIVPEDRVGTILNIAKKHDIEANVIGKTTDKKGVRIKHKGKMIDITIQ